MREALCRTCSDIKWEKLPAGEREEKRVRLRQKRGMAGSGRRKERMGAAVLGEMVKMWFDRAVG